MATATWDNLSEAKRSRILAVARTEFARAGYQAGSLNVIAAEAQIAKGSLFQYFDDKLDLFATVISDNAARIAAATIDQIDPDLAFFDLVDDLARRWVAFFVADPEAYRLSQTVSNSGDPTVTEASRRAGADRFRSALCPAIVAGLERGDIRADADVDLVLSVLVMYLRHARDASLEPNLDPGMEWSVTARSHDALASHMVTFRRSFAAQSTSPD